MSTARVVAPALLIAVVVLGVSLVVAAEPEPAGVRPVDPWLGLESGVRDAGPLLPDGGAAVPVQGGQLLPYPTDVDEAGQRRREAEAFAADSPETRGVEVIATITDYLEDEDPYVRMMAAAAVYRIAIASEAIASGLRLSVREDAALTAALFDTIHYEHIVGFDDIAARDEALRAVLYLWYEAPNATVRDVVVSRYWDETDVQVRRGVVEVICEHKYADGGAIEVLDDARVDYDAELAARAQACWEVLVP